MKLAKLTASAIIVASILIGCGGHTKALHLDANMTGFKTNSTYPDSMKSIKTWGIYYYALATVNNFPLVSYTDRNVSNATLLGVLLPTDTGCGDNLEEQRVLERDIEEGYHICKIQYTPIGKVYYDACAVYRPPIY